jgi:hypothetical protein
MEAARTRGYAFPIANPPTEAAMQKVEPQSEHRWLQQLLGDWTYETEAIMGPDQPPVKMSGSESARPLGDVWVLCEASGMCPGEGPAVTLMTLGYDPAKKRFVGTFIGTMMTNLWVYDGRLEGNTLTLDAEGPSFAGDGTTAKYQDIIEIKGPDERTLSSRMLTPDGKWQHFMTSTYRRRK